ncbi:MAG: hypothetical protein OEW60_05305, partial [Thiovulaceae bacterium]|nr:hypothetical protein [Sulfurimonadaceae bacterium]
YPIKVYLEPSKYDLKVIQKQYKNLQYYSDETNLQILLHFAPYKIFDATNTVGFIKKGSANIYLDDIKGAKGYLKKGTRTSKVNQIIADAITDALNQDPRRALKKFKKIIKQYPKHAILQYNTALIYAKLGNLKEANKHFIKSYHLDAKNYMAGIFAIMTSKIVGLVNIKQIQHFKENLLKEIETADIAFVQAMMSFYDKGYSSVINWSEEQKLNTPMQHALLLLASQKFQKIGIEKNESKKLVALLPQDVLAHTLYIHAHYRDLNNKEFSTQSIAYLKKLDLSLNELFYGSMITQKLFIDYTFVTGHLYELSQKLSKQLSVESKNVVNIMHALAFSNIYLGKFEEAFVLYNTLIDEYKEQGSETLFNAAVAAVGADHHENAIALLELANLKNRYNYESRYALGLLYIEAKNYNAASFQFSRVTGQRFLSQYFNFMIDSISIGEDLIQTNND